MRRGVLGLLALLLIAGCGGSNDRDVAPSASWGSGDAGFADGGFAAARFRNPVNVETAPDGTVYVADFDNDAVRAINPSGIVTTLVRREGFSRPFGLTLAPDGALFVQTDANDTGARDGTTGTIWRVNRSNGEATVVARNLGRPRGIVAISNTRIACSDLTRNTVYLLDVTTGETTPLAGRPDTPGYQDGFGEDALFDRPYGIDRLGDGSLLVADANNDRLRRVELNGRVTTFAGPGSIHTGTDLATIVLNNPMDVSVRSDGMIYVADSDNYRILRINGQYVNVQAGDGTPGYREGNGTDAQFFGLEGLAVSKDGRLLYVADGTRGEEVPYNRVRRVSL